MAETGAESQEEGHGARKRRFFCGGGVSEPRGSIMEKEVNHKSLCGELGSYIFGMSERVAQLSLNTTDFKNPVIGWMIGFLFVVSFLGLFSVVPLRKIMIIDFKLTYPSGTATAHLINSFHTPKRPKLANVSVGKILRFSVSHGVSFNGSTLLLLIVDFKPSRPSMGLKAYQNKLGFDFSTTYIGVGMICPHVINISRLLVGILSWGLLWPLTENKRGDWHPAGLDEIENYLQSLEGYKHAVGMLFKGMACDAMVVLRYAHTEMQPG
ncbi:hypothetical protein K1719_027634 [Acacia pycnantha]|nr:hypothetical protein K1719_027634 [Acacia pycnantha]